MTLKKPILKQCFPEKLTTAFQQQQWQDSIFKEDQLPDKTVIENITIESCVFQKIDFTKVRFKAVDLMDVVFEDCDLSNQVFDERLLCRVVFKRCKLVGFSLINAVCQDVEMIDCQARYINLANTTIRRMKLKDSDLSEASFLENKVKNLTIENVIFRRTEFIKVPLKDVDFSTCDIATAFFDYDSLKGIIIDMMQSATLVGMLGVRVKELL